jgi:ribosomal protein S18 acetylase RimI-like enzyme
MAASTDAELYHRGAETLLASWDAYTRGSPGAAVTRHPGVATAVFPTAPERAVYNNALLDRGLAAPERAAALEATEAAYVSAGIPRFAAWVHESDAAMRADLEARGYTLDETTRAMGMDLSDLRLPPPEIGVAPPDWAEYLRVVEVPRGLLRGVDQTMFHVRIGRLDGESVAAAMAFDHGDDCGIYNVGTRAHARRRGLGTGVTALLLHDARARGCRTASIQSTAMAERVYAAVGFRDLGRFLEFVPGAYSTTRRSSHTRSHSGMPSIVSPGS